MCVLWLLCDEGLCVQTSTRLPYRWPVGPLGAMCLHQSLVGRVRGFIYVSVTFRLVLRRQ